MGKKPKSKGSNRCHAQKHGLRRIVSVLLLSTCLLAGHGCQEEVEPEPIKETFTYTLDISPTFFSSNTEYIVSDFSGKILAIEKFFSPGLNTIEVQAPVDEQFHLSIFNGSLITYAFAPPATYKVQQFFNPNAFTQLQNHRINMFSTTSQIVAGGAHIQASFRNNESQLELLMDSDKSDALISLSEFGGPGRYFYLPEVRAGESSTLTQDDFNNAPELEVVPANFPQGFMLLEASRNANDSVFNYDLFIQTFNPFQGGLFLPSASVLSTFKRYHVTFFGFSNNQYEGYLEQIPTQIKQVSASVAQVRFREQALTYDIHGDASAVIFQGFSQGMFWSVHAPLGTGMKVNLPKFDDGFSRSRNIPPVDQVVFSSGIVVKDTRGTVYYQYVSNQIDQRSLKYAGDFEIMKTNFTF